MIVKHFDPNTTGRDFVVGDLHGCYYELLNELKLYNFDEQKDRLFAVGDLIDRGPYSFDCLSLILKPWFHSVRGNHEDMMAGSIGLPLYEIEGPKIWRSNGSEWFDKGKSLITSELKQAIEDLPLVIVLHKTDGTRINIVHAEFPEGITDKDIDDEKLGNRVNLMWQHWRGKDARHVAKNPNFLTVKDYVSMDSGLSRSYMGHTVIRRPVTLGAYNFIDTGVVFGGNLTMVQISP